MAIGALKDEAGARASWDFCYEILPDVSRTFALTIPVLERPLSGSVCVAYLLCRIADTIEDRNDLELEPRRWFYRQFAEIVADPPSSDQGAGLWIRVSTLFSTVGQQTPIRPTRHS
jgi:phytoene/squalene synthetase